MLVLAGPLVLSTGASTVQQFVNRMFLTWYSPEALAASLPAGTLSFTVLCFFIGTASYANTFVAQYHGARQPERVASAVWHAVYLALFSGILVIPLALLAEPLFALAGHAAAVRDLEIQYYRLLVLGGGFAVLSAALSTFFTGLGHMRTVMWVNVVGTLCNAGLDYLLIFGHHGFPRLGIVGAAYASIISSALGALLFGVLFVLGPVGRSYGTWAARVLDRDLFVRLLRYGAPSGLHFMLDLLAWSVFILLVGRLGVTVLAATNLAFQVNSIVFLPMIGFSIATATLVGQRLGDNDPDLAARATWSAFALTFGYMSCFALLYVVIPRAFLMPFGAGADPMAFAPTRDMAVVMLRFVALYSLFDGANLVFSAALKGAGDTLFVMLVSSALSIGLMVVPTWVICHDGKGSVWAAWGFLTLFICVLALCFLWRFLQGKWRSMRVTGGVHAPHSPAYPQPQTPVTDVDGW